MKLGRIQWAVILIVTALLVVFAPSGNDDAVKTGMSKRQVQDNSGIKQSNTDRPRSGMVGRVELERLAKLQSRQNDQKKVGDVFDSTSWYVAPPKPRYVPPPPAPMPVVIKPTAPPMPFTYLGRYGDTGSRIIILSKGSRVYTVAVGEVIENTYRLEKLTPGLVYLTYLPLNAEQTLRTGDSL